MSSASKVKSSQGRHASAQESPDFDSAPAVPAQLKVFYDYSQVEEADFVLLQKIVGEIRVRHRLILADVIKIGEQLTIAKELLPFGEFERWAKAEFDMSASSARDFRNIYERFGRDPIYLDTLTSTTARMLARGTVRDEVVEAVVVLGQQTGRPLRVSETKEVIRQYPHVIDAVGTLVEQDEEEEPDPNQIRKFAVLARDEVWDHLRNVLRFAHIDRYLTRAETDELMVAIGEGLMGDWLVEVREQPASPGPANPLAGPGIEAPEEPAAALLSFDEWLDLMPASEDLEGTVKVFRVARQLLMSLRRQQPDLAPGVTHMLTLWERLIEAIEKRMPQ